VDAGWHAYRGPGWWLRMSEGMLIRAAFEVMVVLRWSLALTITWFGWLVLVPHLW
jgi:hypothetical protein